MKQWFNAHQHGRFSMLDGLCHYDKLAERAKELGMTSISLTEHGNVHGILDFYDEVTATGLKPVLGMEAYGARKTRFDQDEEERAGKALTEFEQRGPHHLTVLARNYEGYRNLIKLSSRAFLEGFYVKPRLDHELITEHAEGLVVLSGCLAGEVCQALLRHDYEHALHTAAWYQQAIGKEHYFIEVMNHGLPEQIEIIPQLVKIAGTIGAPIVPTADCHYVHKEDSHAHDVMLAVSTKATIHDEKRFRFYNDQFYLKSYDEMAEIFPEEWLKNSLLIPDQVDLKLEFGELYFPEYPKVPAGKTVDSFLEELIWKGIRIRYGEPSREVRDRTEYELSVVKRMGFQSYFLVVWDLVKAAKDNGIRVGWGRGSAAGSILSYALGITELDPLRFGLLFERFLVEGRKSMPDIDLDFDDRYRDWVIDYARATYGDDHVSHICTFSTVGAKQAIRDAQRALGHPYAIGDRISKLVPAPVLGVAKTLAECMENAEFKKGTKDQESQEILAGARGLEGLYRQTGIHAAGVVISQSPTMDFVPVMRRNLKNGNPGPIVTQWDMHRVEQNGQLKIDFLSLRNLSVMDICIVDMIQKLHGTLIDDKQLPLDDAKTYEEICAGNTMGVFQLESAGMREMTVSMQPDSIDDLAALVALYRPGPMNSGMDRMYIARKNGREKVTYVHPKLKEILSDNYGIMLYQEDVLRVTRELAGFDAGEADDLRKVMGKKLVDKVQLFRQKFVQGAMQYSGVEGSVANKIYSDIEYFAGYGFNKAHAYSYAMVTYVTAYLKAHYPAEYMAALLTSVTTKPEKQTLYLNECRRLGIQVHPPSINQSFRDFTVLNDQEILFGLKSVRGVGEATVLKLARAEGAPEYRGIHDFFRRINPDALNKATFEHLIFSGALDDLLPDKPDRQLTRDERRNIFDLEKKELGLYILEHPLWGVWNIIEPNVTHSMESFDGLSASTMVTVAGLVSDVNKLVTKRGDLMMRFTLEDMTSSREVIAFPKETSRMSPPPENGDIVIVRGRLQHDGDEEFFTIKVILGELEYPDLSAADNEESIVLRFDRGLNYSIMKTIEQIIEDSPGRSPVYVKYPHGRHEFTLAFKKPTSSLVKEQLQSLVALDQGSDIYA